MSYLRLHIFLGSGQQTGFLLLYSLRLLFPSQHFLLFLFGGGHFQFGYGFSGTMQIVLELFAHCLIFLVGILELISLLLHPSELFRRFHTSFIVYYTLALHLFFQFGLIGCNLSSTCLLFHSYSFALQAFTFFFLALQALKPFIFQTFCFLAPLLIGQLRFCCRFLLPCHPLTSLFFLLLPLFQQSLLFQSRSLGPLRSCCRRCIFCCQHFV
mmetsp:Transcript_17639/g.38147  ORF Transcript_17639/g.38147 Transcript_17639/m.38147 type:complete len:212 (-) Transcript_17639:210-845(-)